MKHFIILFFLLVFTYGGTVSVVNNPGMTTQYKSISGTVLAADVNKAFFLTNLSANELIIVNDGAGDFNFRFQTVSTDTFLLKAGEVLEFKIGFTKMYFNGLGTDADFRLLIKVK